MISKHFIILHAPYVDLNSIHAKRLKVLVYLITNVMAS